MIVIPRGLARSVRALARRCVSGRPRGPAPPVVFESTAGKVLVWLEVEIETDVQLGEERPLIATEGELLVF